MLPDVGTRHGTRGCLSRIKVAKESTQLLLERCELHRIETLPVDEASTKVHLWLSEEGRGR